MQRREYMLGSVFSVMIILVLQIITNYGINKLDLQDYDEDFIDKVPSSKQAQLLSFGDEQFYFRTSALKVQNFSHHFGDFTALVDYNYDKLIQWFEMLDRLDGRSNLVPSFASYYYSQTPNKEQLRKIVNYIENRSKNLESSWWWRMQAVFT